MTWREMASGDFMSLKAFSARVYERLDLRRTSGSGVATFRICSQLGAGVQRRHKTGSTRAMEGDLRWLLEFLDPRRFAEWYHAITRVRSVFRHRHGVAPCLLRPQTFSEKMQWRKLFDLNPQFVVFSDKLRARDFISQRVGAGVLAPLLWVGDDPDAVPFEMFEVPYVVKSTHAARQTIIVTDAAAFDVALARATMKSWLGVCFGTLVDEPGYTSVPRRIMVERCLLDRSGKRPRELLFFVFKGQVHYIMAISVESGERRSAGFHDRHWRRLDWSMRKPPDTAMPRPQRFDEMVKLAERLGAGIDHVRVDLYDCGDSIFVGELTVYSWSGTSPFHRREMDAALGAPWRIKYAALRALFTVLLRRRNIIQRPRAIDRSLTRMD